MKIGIDIGGSHISIGVINNNGVIVEKVEKRLTQNEKRNIKKSIEDYIVEYANIFIEKYKVNEIGIAIPGTQIDGVAISTGNLGIKDYNIVERLQNKIKLPIKINNDAKCAAIAENKYGCLKGYDRSIFLTLGTGIGGAAFLDNKLLKAGKRPGYEFGHMVIERNGIPCMCGKKGCFERYASMKVFRDNLRKALNLDETTRSQDLLQIIQTTNENDKNYKIIENVINEYIENLSIGIMNLIEIFEPEIVGIGGSFSYFEEIFLERLQNKINAENSRKSTREKIIIKVAILGNDAGMIGAVCD